MPQYQIISPYPIVQLLEALSEFAQAIKKGEVNERGLEALSAGCDSMFATKAHDYSAPCGFLGYDLKNNFEKLLKAVEEEREATRLVQEAQVDAVTETRAEELNAEREPNIDDII